MRIDRPLSVAQWSAIAGALAVLVWSVPGLILNPDFATGDDATSVRVLAVDMNGWHAVSGFLIALPALFAATRRDLAVVFDLVAAGSLYATAVWAALETQVAGGLFYFPNNEADALLHVGTATIFLVGGVDGVRLRASHGRRSFDPSS
jgi:Domain of unknown function (DUF4383)